MHDKMLNNNNSVKWNDFGFMVFVLAFYLSIKLLFLINKIMKTCIYKIFIITVLMAICTVASAQKVYSVKYENQADLKVFVVKYENQADLNVYKVKYENQAGDNNGKWFFTDYGNQAKFTIYFVEYENQADLKIYFVEYENQAGWRERDKMQLLY